MIVALLCPLLRNDLRVRRQPFSLGNDLLIRQQISQYDLAAMVGGGREYVARTLSNWQDRKLVSRRRSGCYCLENKALLELEVKYR